MNSKHILTAIGLSLILTGCQKQETIHENSLSEPLDSHTSIIAIPMISDTTEETAAISETNKKITVILESHHSESTSEMAETANIDFTESILTEPSNGTLVRILDYIPDAVIDLRYATDNNFTHTAIYDHDEAYLCYGTVKKLQKVQDALKENQYRMIIWDAYRSPEAQQKLWDVYPNPTYVADPRKGLTSHSRGNTIDIGLVHMDGTSVVLPSAFDEFSRIADRDYSDVSVTAGNNAKLLEKIMYANGFTGYFGEWWDYSDTETYPLIIPD